MKQKFKAGELVQVRSLNYLVKRCTGDVQHLTEDKYKPFANKVVKIIRGYYDKDVEAYLYDIEEDYHYWLGFEFDYPITLKLDLIGT